MRYEDIITYAYDSVITSHKHGQSAYHYINGIHGADKPHYPVPALIDTMHTVPLTIELAGYSVQDAFNAADYYDMLYPH